MINVMTQLGARIEGLEFDIEKLDDQLSAGKFNEQDVNLFVGAMTDFNEPLETLDSEESRLRALIT